MLQCINPHAVFRQSPWDHDIPSEYSLESLSFTNIFYVPYYGFYLVDSFSPNKDTDVNSPDANFYRNCAQVFCETSLTKAKMAYKNKRGEDNLVVTGHPKLERILEDRNNPQWPIVNQISKKITRIIWAPHHSFKGGDWLAFGLFKETYKDILEWVKTDNTIEIVLKPHPALYASLITQQGMGKQELDVFLSEWNSLQNTSILEEGEYGGLMAASDMMITDGISFLAEYMIFWKKPLIFLENMGHAPFNDMGKLVQQASYSVKNVEEA